MTMKPAPAVTVASKAGLEGGDTPNNMTHAEVRVTGHGASGGLSRAESAPRLIIGKITPPAQTPDAVIRTRLIQGIFDHARDVVLVLAPAGFGKSTLMAQLHEHALASGAPAAWLTLDQRDNDLSRFLAYFHAVASRLLPIQLLPSTVRISGPGQYFGRQADATALIDALASSSRPYWLFIDDIEHVDAQEVLHVVQELIDNLQEGQHLVLGSRSIHQLSLRALELGGRLMRIGSSHLRFDVAETEDFVSRQEGLHLSPTDSKLMLDRTHGWAAGLRLVALSLTGRSDCTEWLATLSGSSASIAEYLAENVLGRLPEHACRFLVYSSVLEQLNGELCDAILDRSDSQDLLRQFERSNLFLTRIAPAVDPNLLSYRFHSLFRDFLLQELQQADPTAILELNRRAARWHASHQRFMPAIDYALRAHDSVLAAEIMDGCIMGFIEVAQMETVARWIDAIPPDITKNYLHLQRARAYAMIALHRYEEAEDALNHCRVAAAKRGEPVPLEVTIQFTLLHEFADRHDLAEKELVHFSDQLDEYDAASKGIACNISAYHDIAHSRFDAAREVLSRAKFGGDAANANSWSATYTSCFEGLIELLQGNVREAMTRFDAAKMRAKGAAVGVASSFLAQTLYETDDRLSASSLLNEYLRLVRDTADVDTIIVAYRVASRAAFVDGNDRRVESLLSELGDIGDARGVSRPKACAWLEKSRLSLLRGDCESARRYLELGSNPRIWQAHSGLHLFANELEDPATAAARFQLVSGNAGQAVPMLKRLLDEANATGRLWRRTHLQNLLGQALVASGDIRSGLSLLESVLCFAYRNHLQRVISDEPWLLHEPLEELKRRVRIIPADYLDRQKEAGDRLLRDNANMVATNVICNPLTTRESGLLRLVVDGRSNKEIARLLDISENTVETHLRRINQKLDTHNRTQAIARARELGLLH